MFGIGLTGDDLVGDAVVYAAKLTSGIGRAGGQYRYVSRQAERAGGIAKLRIKRRSTDSYAVSLTAYGDFHRATARMTTHVQIGGEQWTLTGNWAKTVGGWVLR